MITNILASIVITLVTNTVETLPKHYVIDPGPASTGNMALAVAYGHYEPDASPKEKWITTNVVEVTTVTFEAMKKQFEAKSERSVTNWTTHFWIEPPAPPPPAKWIADTNSVEIPATWFWR